MATATTTKRRERRRKTQFPSVIQLTLETTSRLLRADVSVLYLRNNRTGQFEIKGCHPQMVALVDQLHTRLNLPSLLLEHEKRSHAFSVIEESAPYFSTKNNFEPPLTFFSIPLRIKDGLVGFVNHHRFSRGSGLSEFQHHTVSVLASHAAEAVAKERDQNVTQAEHLFKDTIWAFAQSLEGKDCYTAGHSERVRTFTAMISRGLALPPKVKQLIIEASLLHDIGKLCVDLSALNNTGQLSTSDVALFRAHPRMGREILAPISIFSELVPLVYHHHERFDGSGYPSRLAHYEIPLGARIISVADTYDAMTSHRPYRRAMNIESAIAELRRCSGSQFDPEIVDIFIEQVEKHKHDAGFSAALEPSPIYKE